LSAAGLLKDRHVSTHWYGINRLKESGAIFTEERYSFDGKYVTSAGVSAGIDMALALVAKISGNEAAKAVQLGLQYDPQPPFHCGSPKTAGKALTDSLRKRYDIFLGNLQ
jgi:transcriptional regulator GlxA family with amidase domain